MVYTIEIVVKECVMMKTIGSIYFSQIENYRDWLKVTLAVTYLITYYYDSGPGFEMIHFNDIEGWGNVHFNMVNVSCLSFSMLILMQWITVATAL
jgi:hypothetical protein